MRSLLIFLTIFAGVISLGYIEDQNGQNDQQTELKSPVTRLVTRLTMPELSFSGDVTITRYDLDITLNHQQHQGEVESRYTAYIPPKSDPVTITCSDCSGLNTTFAINQRKMNTSPAILPPGTHTITLNTRSNATYIDYQKLLAASSPPLLNNNPPVTITLVQDQPLTPALPLGPSKSGNRLTQIWYLPDYTTFFKKMGLKETHKTTPLSAKIPLNFIKKLNLPYLPHTFTLFFAMLMIFLNYNTLITLSKKYLNPLFTALTSAAVAIASPVMIYLFNNKLPVILPEMIHNKGFPAAHLLFPLLGFGFILYFILLYQTRPILREYTNPFLATGRSDYHIDRIQGKITALFTVTFPVVLFAITANTPLELLELLEDFLRSI